MKTRNFIWLLFFSTLLFYNCSESSQNTTSVSSSKLFTLIPSEKSGLDFRNDLEENIYTRWNMLTFEYYYNGGGIALGDFNNDGLEDVFCTGNTADNKLYLNKGDLIFEDVTTKSGIKAGGWSTGASVADVNQDGYLDIYVCQAGPDENPNNRRNLLYINNGDMSFTEEAQKYGLDDPNLSIQAAFFDYDKDGDLDCYIMNEFKFTRVKLGEAFKFIDSDKKNLIEASGRFLKNTGDNKFVDITEAAGVLKYGHGLGLCVSDINKDGWMDIYVSNDYSVPDFLYINQKDGTFKDEIKSRTKQIAWFSMGCDIADINNDCHLDFAAVDMATGDHYRGKTLMAPMNPALFNAALNLGYQRQYMFNTLQVNDGTNKFNNLASLSGVLASEWSWSAFFADFDNNQTKDYFVSNGIRRYARDNDFSAKMDRIKAKHGGVVPNEFRQELYDNIPQIKLKNIVYKNEGDLEFNNKAEGWEFEIPTYSNGAVYGDLDNDGDLDLIVNNIDDDLHLYKNNTDLKSNYLRLNFVNTKNPIGTKVEIEYGSNKQYLEFAPVRGFQSSVEQRLHFGLDDNKKIDKLTVIWPNNKYQVLRNIDANQILNLDYNNADGLWEYDRKKEANEYFALSKDKIPFVHKENEFNDFEKEILLPYKQSTLGPFIGKGDINNDGLEDFYVGGAKNQSGKLFTQKKDGSFEEIKGPWTNHSYSEDMGSLIFDANGDGLNDLYVISGGNDFNKIESALNDRLYLNKGSNFFYAQNALPAIVDGGLRVKNADIDGDGDQDLFVGGRLIPGFYPNPPRSYILENNGKGVFKDVTSSWSNKLERSGMINDFIWTDVNDDGKEDLIIAYEWDAIKIYTNTGNSFTESTLQYFDKEYKGWWFKLHQDDIDNDGDLDLIAGNLGLNSKFKTSFKKPFEIMANDFDGNGTCDVVLTKSYKGKKVPVRGRQCSSEQMPVIADKFETYEAFANASISDILGEEKIEEALKLEVNTFESAIFINENGKYKHQILNRLAQSFPVYGIQTEDLNKDGKKDIILSGNLHGMEIETPRLDAGYGLVLASNDKGGYDALNVSQSGLYVPGDVKDMTIINGNKKQLLITNNNGPIENFDLSLD